MQGKDSIDDILSQLDQILSDTTSSRLPIHAQGIEHRGSNTLLTLCHLWSQIIESSPDIVFIHDGNYNLVQTNKAYCIEANESKSSIIGKPFHHIFPEGDSPTLLSQNSPLTIDQDSSTVLTMEDGRTFSLRSLFKSDDDGGLMFGAHVLRDISSATRMQRRINRVNRIYAVLLDCVEIILKSRDINTLFHSLCNQLVHSGGFKMVWIGLIDNEKNELLPAAISGSNDEYVDNLLLRANKKNEESDLFWHAINTKRPTVTRESGANNNLYNWTNEEKKRGIQSILSLPLTNRDNCIGSLNIHSADADDFDEEEINLLQTLSENLCYAAESIKAKESHQRAEAELAIRIEAIERSHNAVIITELKSSGPSIIYSNPAFTKITGYSNKEIIDKSPAFFWEGI